jgi:hypothetical protein
MTRPGENADISAYQTAKEGKPAVDHRKLNANAKASIVSFTTEVRNNR